MAVLLAVPFLLFLGVVEAQAAPGDANRDFGYRGLSQPALGNSSGQISFDSVTQPDGKIVMVGRTASGGSAIAARYLPDGSLDSGFGTGGFVSFEGMGFDGVTVDQSDRIVISGHQGDRAAVVRLLADGSPDPAFGLGGVFSTRIELDEPYEGAIPPERPRMNGIAALEDGSILAAGRGSNGCSYEYGCEFVLMMRLDDDGSPLIMEGQSDGTHAVEEQEVSAIDVLPDGKLVVATRFTHSDGYYSYDITTVRLFEAPAADGELTRRWSRTFDSDPHAPTGGGRVVPTDDGGFLLASGSALFKGLPGGPDPDFGKKGLGGFDADQFRIGSQGYGYQAGDVAIDESGRLIVAGLITRAKSAGGAFVARMDSQGKADPTFSNNGLRIVSGWMGRGDGGLILPRVSVTGDSYLLAGSAIRSGSSRFSLRSFEGGNGPTATCDGRTATWIGTDGRDGVRVDSGVIVTGGGDDGIQIETLNPDTVICAGDGEDRIRMYGGKAFGGPGRDQVDGSKRKDRRTKELLPSDEEIHGGPGVDQLDGLAGNDRIFGGGGPDTILGGEGDDDLYGGAGEDELTGEEGNDHLFGGPGRDYLEGGPKMRPHSYYSGKIGNTETELVRVGQTFILTRVRTPHHCGRYSSYTYWSRLDEKMKIGKNGKLEFSDDYFDEQFEARLKDGKITGRYRYTSSDDYDTCWTGKGMFKPWVRIRADFDKTRRQKVRQ